MLEINPWNESDGQRSDRPIRHIKDTAAAWGGELLTTDTSTSHSLHLMMGQWHSCTAELKYGGAICGTDPQSCYRGGPSSLITVSQQDGKHGPGEFQSWWTDALVLWYRSSSPASPPDYMSHCCQSSVWVTTLTTFFRMIPIITSIQEVI